MLNVVDFAFPFVIPTDTTLIAIYGSYSPVVAFIPATNITLYTAIATAPENTTVFTIVSESITPASQAFMYTVTYPANTPVSGSNTGLNIPLTAGTRVAIVCGFTTEAGVGAPAQALPFSYTGSMLFL